MSTEINGEVIIAFKKCFEGGIPKTLFRVVPSGKKYSEKHLLSILYFSILSELSQHKNEILCFFFKCQL